MATWYKACTRGRQISEAHRGFTLYHQHTPNNGYYNNINALSMLRNTLKVLEDVFLVDVLKVHSLLLWLHWNHWISFRCHSWASLVGGCYGSKASRQLFSIGWLFSSWFCFLCAVTVTLNPISFHWDTHSIPFFLCLLLLGESGVFLISLYYGF